MSKRAEYNLISAVSNFGEEQGLTEEQIRDLCLLSKFFMRMPRFKHKKYGGVNPLPKVISASKSFTGIIEKPSKEWMIDFIKEFYKEEKQRF